MRSLAAVLGVFCLTASAVAEECTVAKPCTPIGVEFARKRIVLERGMAARMADAPVTEHNIKATNNIDSWLKEGIALERRAFSGWCALMLKMQSDLFTRDVELTSDRIFPYTGEPDSDERITRNGAEGRLWTWSEAGPLSGAVVFGVLFTRPAGTQRPWVFAGCQWCASGNAVTTRGCVELPFIP